MPAIQFLTKADYLDNAERRKGGHWAKAEKRWQYHERAIELLKTIPLSSAQNVLEMGTMGASLVYGSDTLDYGIDWPRGPQEATYFHDARIMPWPIADRKYECLVALRVFQHLVPKQRECFAEAKRVARNVVLLVPDRYPATVTKNRKSGAITPEQFREWNGGKDATQVIPFGNWIGTLYHWNENDYG